MLQWREIVTGKQSLFFTMTNGGGTNFWGIFFFFVSSPFSFLIFLFPESRSVQMMDLIVAAKIAAAAWTSALMFHKILKSLDRFLICILSVTYAFCGFTLMFFQNLVWLDFVCLFPLLVYSLFRMKNTGRYGLYTAVLTAMLMTNYYMSYMAVLFIILFALTYVVFAKDSARFAAGLIFSSLFSGLATAWIWMPALIQYFDSARAFSILQTLASGNMFTYYETTLAILFSTGFLLVLFPLTLFHAGRRKVPVRLYFLYGLMIIPLVIEPVNKIWHTGSYQAFPARYGYITVLLGLILAGYYLAEPQEMLMHPREDRALRGKPWNVILSAFMVLLTGAACWASNLLLERHLHEMSAYSTTLWGDSTSIQYISGIFFGFGLCYSLLILFRSFGRLPERLFRVLTATLLASEILLNGGIYIGHPANDVSYYDSIFDLKDRIQDDGVYRVKTRLKYYDVNMTGALGYDSLATYTSLTSQKYLYAMKKLGFSSYWMEVNSSHGTAWSDALMADQYRIELSGQPVFFSEKKIYQNDGYQIIENPDTLGLAFGISRPTLDELAQIPDGTRFDIQNRLFTAITGIRYDLFTSYGFTSSENLSVLSGDRFIVSKIAGDSYASLEYDIHVTGRQILYFDLFDSLSAQLVEHINDSCRIYVDGMLIQDSFPSKNSNGIVELGKFEDSDVHVTVEVLRGFDARSFGVAGMDVPLLEEGIAAIREQSGILSVTQAGNRITVQADPGADTRYIALSVPFYKNMYVTVNGRPAEALPFLDDFIAVPVDSGVSEIRIVMVPDGFAVGAAVSAAVLILAGVLYLVKRKARAPEPTIVEYLLPGRCRPVLRLLFIAFGVAVFAGIYLFPVAYHLIRHFGR